eukprot:8887709-Pyramimonas_sp.AAC.1
MHLSSAGRRWPIACSPQRARAQPARVPIDRRGLLAVLVMSSAVHAPGARPWGDVSPAVTAALGAAQ